MRWNSSSTRALQATPQVFFTILKLQASTFVSWQMFGAQVYMSLHFIGRRGFAMFALSHPAKFVVF